MGIVGDLLPGYLENLLNKVVASGTVKNLIDLGAVDDVKNLRIYLTRPDRKLIDTRRDKKDDDSGFKSFDDFDFSGDSDDNFSDI